MATIGVSRCPACGAPLPPGMPRCPYCDSYLVADGPTNRAPRTEAQQASREAVRGLLFERRVEPNEHAFTLSVPKGWRIAGGILRTNLTQQVVDVQSIEAKVDFTVKRDDPGTVAIRWCPEVKYCDMRRSPAAMFGAFPQGSLYQGMVVMPSLLAQDFLVRLAIPWAHPQATDVQVVAQRREPLLVQAYHNRMAAFGGPPPAQYDGAIVVFRYTEAGTRFEEKAFTVVEDLGPPTGGMWSNKETVLLRAPEGELDLWEPALHRIRESVTLDLAWLARELASQEILRQSFLSAQQAEIARNRRMMELQRQMQQLDRRITEHRMRTNAEIHNDAYLTLMELEEYVNPYTGKPEVGSNQWHYRWVTEGGEEFYTDHEEDDPNIPGLANRTDWRRTPVRPRSPNG